MSRFPSVLSLLLIAFFISTSMQHEGEFRCIHDEVDKYPLIFDGVDQDVQITADNTPNDQDPARHLQTTTTTTTPSSRRMTFRIVYDNLTVTANSPYYRTLVESVIDYFGRLLNVTETVTLKRLTANTRYCNILPNTSLVTTGFSEDMLVFITSETVTTNYMATAQACAVFGTARRPYISRITFNTNFVASTTNELTYANHIGVTIHEFIHALGFSSSLITFYPNTNRTSSTKVDNGFTRSYLRIGKPVNGLQDELQAHFGCNSIIGGLFEQEGGSGSAGSHWERRVFYNEIMTASAIKDLRVTNFTLKLLDNMGWYVVNYTFAEPTNFGRGKGCSFYEGPCANNVTRTANFQPEYCSTLGARDCTYSRKQGGYCGTARSPQTTSTTLGAWNYMNSVVMDESFADNCPTKFYFSNKDCEDTTVSRLFFETFGRNSRCFMGTINSRTASYTSPVSLCLDYNCVRSNAGAWVISYILNGTTVNCTTPGNMAVTGFASGSWLECPDPTSFCTNQGVKYCRFNCFGRGTCNPNGSCTCQAGFTGPDCGRKI